MPQDKDKGKSAGAGGNSYVSSTGIPYTIDESNFAAPTTVDLTKQPIPQNGGGKKSNGKINTPESQSFISSTGIPITIDASNFGEKKNLGSTVPSEESSVVQDGKTTPLNGVMRELDYTSHSPSISESAEPVPAQTRRRTPFDVLKNDIENNTKYTAEKNTKLPDWDIRSIAKDFSPDEIIESEENLPKYLSKRYSDIEKDLTKLANAKLGTILSKNQLSGFGVQNLNDYKTQINNVDEQIEQKQSELNDLKSSAVIVTASKEIANYLNDPKSFNSEKAGRKLLKVQDPNVDAQIRMVESGGLPIPEIVTSDMKQLALSIYGSIVNQMGEPSEENIENAKIRVGRLAEIIKNNPNDQKAKKEFEGLNRMLAAVGNIQSLKDKIQKESDTFDEDNPQMTWNRAKEKWGYFFHKKGMSGVLGYGSNNLLKYIDDPEVGLTESEKKVTRTLGVSIQDRLATKFNPTTLFSTSPGTPQIPSTDIPGSGFWRSLKNSFDQTISGMGKTLTPRSDAEKQSENLDEETRSSGYMPVGENQRMAARWQQLLEKSQTKSGIDANEKKELDYLTGYVNARNSLTEALDLTGQITAQVATIAFTTKGLGLVGDALKGASLLKASGIASMLPKTVNVASKLLSNEIAGIFTSSYLMAKDNYDKQALQLMPEPEQSLKRSLYSNIMTGAEAASELLFRDTKVLKAFTGGLSPIVAKNVVRYMNGEITREIAMEEIMGAGRLYLKTFGKEFLKSEIEEPSEEAIIDIFQPALNAAFGISGFDIAQTAKQAGETFATTAIGSGLVSGMAAHGAYRQRNARNAYIKGHILEMGKDPVPYYRAVNELKANGGITQKEANEKISLIKSANKYFSELPEKRNVEITDKSGKKFDIQIEPFSSNQAASYVLHRMNEGILNEKLENTTDEVEKESIKKELNRSSEIRKGIYNGSIDVTTNGEPVTDSKEVSEKTGVMHTSEADENELGGTRFSEKPKETDTPLMDKMKERKRIEAAEFDEQKKNKGISVVRPEQNVSPNIASQPEVQEEEIEEKPSKSLISVVKPGEVESPDVVQKPTEDEMNAADIIQKELAPKGITERSQVHDVFKEELGSSYDADVIDNAFDMYQRRGGIVESQKQNKNATEQQGMEVRPESQQGQAEVAGDSNLPEGDQSELQDGEAAQKEKKLETIDDVDSELKKLFNPELEETKTVAGKDGNEKEQSGKDKRRTIPGELTDINEVAESLGEGNKKNKNETKLQKGKRSFATITRDSFDTLVTRLNKAFGGAVKVFSNWKEFAKNNDSRVPYFMVSDYRGEHKAPTGDDGASAPLYDLTNIYGEDIYSGNAWFYFGDGDRVMDKKSAAILQGLRNNPNANITIYRAVPDVNKDVDQKKSSLEINSGDWVSINKDYAVEHGKRYLNGNYKIVTKTVKASQVFMNGDSLHEQGVKFMRNNDNDIFGAVLPDGSMYLNPEKINANTPIHEHTHLFNQVIQKTNPKLWSKIVEATKGTELWDEVKNDPNYSNLKTDSQIADEVFSRITGDRGEGSWQQRINEADSKSPLGKLKDLIKEYWDKVREFFGADIYKDMSANEFADMALSQLLGGKEIKGAKGNIEQSKQNAERNKGLSEMQMSVLDKSDFDKDGNVKPEVAEAIKKEYADIEAKAKADGTWMKAPNGKPSNLNEMQWVQVRSSRFKKWFGDWENDPQNASKVVDSNGEPMVVYHGARSNEYFHIFNDELGDKRSDAPYGTSFFSSDREVAKSYSNNVYEVFLNVKDPATIDFSGADWQGDIYDKYEAEYLSNGDYEFLYNNEGSSYFDSIDEIYKEARKQEIDEDLIEIRENPYVGYNTNSFTEEAMSLGNDGAIIYQVVDNGSYGNNGASDVYVAFSPNQIKSATDNVGAFSSESNDIRFQVSDEKNNSIKVGEKSNTIEQYLEKATDVLNQLYPDAKIKIYNSEQEYYDKEKRPVGSMGVFHPKEKVLALNVPLIQKSGETNTIFHEVIHPIVNEAILSKEGALDDVWDKLIELKDVKGMESVFAHIQSYHGRGINIQKAEGITEFLTQVADGNIDISGMKESVSAKIIDLINLLFERLGVKTRLSTATDLKRLADSVKAAFDSADTTALQKTLGRRVSGDISEISMDAISEKEQEDAIRNIIERAKGIDENELKKIIKKHTGWDDAKVDSFFPGAKQQQSQSTQGQQNVVEIFPGDRAIMKRIFEGSNLPKELKDLIEEKGLKENVRDQKLARAFADSIVDTFGIDNALKLVNANKFHGDVASAVYIKALNDIFLEEQKAKTQKDKSDFANQYADIIDEYQTASSSSGRFISMIQQFYRSPAGMVVLAKRKMDDRVNDWFKGREKSAKEAFDEFIKTVEGKEIFEEAAKNLKGEKKQIFTKEGRQKVSDFFDKLKINTKTSTGSYLVPPQIYNAAVDIIKQSVLTGMSIASAIEKGVIYIDEKLKEGKHPEQWNKKDFKNDVRIAFDKQNFKKELTPEQKKKLLDKWLKRLSGLPESKVNKLLNSCIQEFMDLGALEFDRFKELYAKAAGLPVMTEELKKKLIDYTEKVNKPTKLREEINELLANKDADKAEMKKKAAEYTHAIRDAEGASKGLNEMIGKERHWFDTFLTTMRLNLLGTISLVGNVGYNVAAMPIRFTTDITKYGFDLGIAGIQNITDKLFRTKLYERKIIPNPLSIQGVYFRGMWTGLKVATRQLVTGVSNLDYFQRESLQNIRSWSSAKRLIRAMTGRERLTFNQTANAIIEATPIMGGYANFVSRMLNLGDKPFRFAAEYAQAYREATKLGYKGLQRELFVLAPREDVADIIQKHGESITWQQKNVITSLLDSVGRRANSFIDDKKSRSLRVGYGALRLIGYVNQPFLNTPLNVFNELFKYSFSPYPAILAARAIAKKDVNAATKNLAIATIGFALQALAMKLIQNGLIVPPDDESDNEKERKGILNYGGGSRVNIDGLKRLLTGGDPKRKDGDVTVNMAYWGFVGAILLAKASQYRSSTNEDIKQQNAIMDFIGILPPLLQEQLMQGVFSNTSSAMDAYVKGGSSADFWITSMARTFTSSFTPAALSSFSRGGNEYIMDTKDVTLSKTIMNDLKTKWFAGKDLPIKRNIWGEKIESVPKDENAFVYYMFGINKKKKIDTGQFGYALFDFYNETKNPNVFPPTVGRKLNGHELTPKQYEDLTTLIGQNRKLYVESYINGGDFQLQRMSGGKKEGEKNVIKYLTSAYKKARAYGVAEFFQLYPELSVKNEE